MEPRDMAIGGVFADSKRLVVPIYQRTYEWTPERQIDTLMDYVEAKAEGRLASEPARFLHYMGALLLIPRSGFVFGRIPVFDIVDGQQRITTFQIALAALRDLALERDEQSIADQIRPLLFNLDEASMQDKRSERFKLEPTRLDRSLFRELMTMPLAALQEAYAPYFTQAGQLRKKGVSPPKPLAAWWYIRERSAEFIDEADNPGMRLRALLEAMLQDMHLIVITLAETDDAQVIFETLNFGGEPLAAMDLVRNDVFHRAARNNENIEDLMDTGWAMFETPFWKERATQGRITKPRMDFFLANTLAAETGKETLLNELYAAYKRYSTDRKYPSVEAELQVLRKHAPTYRALVSSEPGPLARLAYALEVFEMRTAYPLVFALNAATSDEHARQAVYRLIESYVVRRAICGLTPKNYNTTFLRLATIARESGGSLEALRIAFTEFSGSSNLFPSDQDLSQAFATKSAYEDIPRPRLRHIFRELEFESRDEYDEVEGLKPDLEIEHILPQTWYEHWPLPDGSNAPPDLIYGLSDEQRTMVERRKAVVHVLGNLTLLTKPANIEVLNYAFDPEKKARLHASLLRLNQDVAAESRWDEQAIVRRAQRLAELAIKVWPTPNTTDDPVALPAHT
ncbi:DUF262 domain-containing protein [Bradyrhizobium sp.]|uniref:DUF262 domain-containing protein n=1 Tax=Bradyrhizobium sp. TaxID=376 RepID=UPI003C6EE0EB